jgi:hypothetical protein
LLSLSLLHLELVLLCLSLPVPQQRNPFGIRNKLLVVLDSGFLPVQRLLIGIALPLTMEGTLFGHAS